MGELYQKMSQDLAIKNLAEGTREQYLRCCCGFARYHMRSPRKMGLGEVKDYLGQLVREGAGPEKLKMHVAGLKFLYGITLDRKEVAEKIPWPKVPHKKPDILSLAEVEQLLEAAMSASQVSGGGVDGGVRRRSADQRGVPAATRGHRQRPKADPRAPGQGRQGSVRDAQ
jgi:site-specific recombinase XerD